MGVREREGESVKERVRERGRGEEIKTDKERGVKKMR